MEVFDGVYLGNRYDAECAEFFSKQHISHVVNVTSDIKNHFEGCEKAVQEVTEHRGLQHRVFIEDNDPQDDLVLDHESEDALSSTDSMDAGVSTSEEIATKSMKMLEELDQTTFATTTRVDDVDDMVDPLEGGEMKEFSTPSPEREQKQIEVETQKQIVRELQKGQSTRMYTGYRMFQKIYLEKHALTSMPKEPPRLPNQQQQGSQGQQVVTDPDASDVPMHPVTNIPLEPGPVPEKKEIFLPSVNTPPPVKETKVFEFVKKPEYLRIPVVDSMDVNIGQFFDQSADYIKKAIDGGDKLLIHCRQGKSRSVTILIAYAMKYLGMSLKQAYEQVDRISNHSININDGFKFQLMRYELFLNENISEPTLNFFPKDRNKRGREIIELYEEYEETENERKRRRLTDTEDITWTPELERRRRAATFMQITHNFGYEDDGKRQLTLFEMFQTKPNAKGEKPKIFMQESTPAKPKPKKRVQVKDKVPKHQTTLASFFKIVPRKSTS